MADPKLTIVIEQKGADGVVKSLKEIQKVGDTTYTRVIKDGQVASETMKTVTGAAKVNYSAITALNTAWIAWGGTIQRVAGWVLDAVKAAQEDEASIVRRNAALQSSIGITQTHIKALDDQADAYSKVYGISDDVTRAVQRQYSEMGATASSIEKLTAVTIALKDGDEDAVESTVKISKFLSGQTDAIKGTTIAVKDNATEADRWAKLQEYAATKVDELNAQLNTTEGAARRAGTAWGEFKEALGGIANNNTTADSLNTITNALQGITDWVNNNHGVLNVLGWIVNPGFKATEQGLSWTNKIMGWDKPPQGVINTGDSNAPKFDSRSSNTGGGGKRGGRGGRIGPSFDFLAFSGVPTIDDFKAMYADIAREAALSVAGHAVSQLTSGWTDNRAGGLMGKAALLAGIFENGPTYGSPNSMITGGGGWGGTSPLAAVTAAARAKALAGGGGGWGGAASGIFGSITGTAAGLAPGRGFPEWWKSHGSDYTQVASGFISGGAQGGLSALGSLAGNAVLPGLGGLLGGLLGGGIGKLFGGHKKRQGETPAQPIYTSDMNLQRLVTDLLNVTKMSIVRGASGGIDAGVKMLNAQNARAGV